MSIVERKVPFAATVTESDRHAECHCGHRFAIDPALQGLPQGAPVRCPVCGHAWRAWQLIVRSLRQAA